MRVFQNTPFVRRGGPPAVDLVNTEILVRGTPADLLPDDDAVAAWFAFERERLELDESPELPHLRDIRRLRATLRQTFTTILADDPPPPEALEEINIAAAREPVELAIDWKGEPRIRAHRTGGRPPVDGLAAIGRSAITFLTGPDRARLGKCGNPGCVLFFIASNRRQQWCSETCGRRVRIARHTRRRRLRPGRGR